MHFTAASIPALILGLSMPSAYAAPLDARAPAKALGTCPPAAQYTCITKAKINALSCVSVLNGNTVSVPIKVLKARDPKKGKGKPETEEVPEVEEEEVPETEEEEGEEEEEEEEEEGEEEEEEEKEEEEEEEQDEKPEVKAPEEKPAVPQSYCCKSKGKLLNLVTCVSLLDGNTIDLPIKISGIL